MAGSSCGMTTGRLRVYGYTLGCRLNACETDAILDGLTGLQAQAERTEVPEEADIIVVNTCAVTGRSQARSRKAVRSLARRNPDAVIAVTGCVAEISPDDFDQVDVLVVPNGDKPGLVGALAARCGIPAAGTPGGEGGFFPVTVPASTARTRAFLKVQDGCDGRCTYCVVPLARGRSKSQPRERVLEQADALRENGYREVVLTGIDLASYGRDLYGGGGYGLPELVRDLLREGGFRLRLSSLEPLFLGSDLLAGLSLPGLCRHFHVPVQSGSDRILGAMGRRYGRDYLERLLDSFAEHFPGAAVGADFIVGFPGEDDEDFRATMELASDPRIAYLHVFPFSPRPGTAAWVMGGRVHPETVSERAVALRKRSAESRRRFRLSQLGTDALALVEGRMHRGRLVGLTDNYIPLLAPEGSTEGSLVRIENLTEDMVCWELR
jgi:threonylcarbamoyladenosine tRNA methylthiotransferase MtaB